MNNNNPATWVPITATPSIESADTISSSDHFYKYTYNIAVGSTARFFKVRLQMNKSPTGKSIKIKNLMCILKK